MGQAKIRGTYEERKQSSIDAKPAEQRMREFKRDQARTARDNVIKKRPPGLTIAGNMNVVGAKQFTVAQLALLVGAGGIVRAPELDPKVAA